MISYEAFETYVQNQARRAKAERDRADKDAFYIGSAEGREKAVFELANYLGIPDEEINRLWEAGTA